MVFHGPLSLVPNKGQSIFALCYSSDECICEPSGLNWDHLGTGLSLEAPSVGNGCLCVGYHESNHWCGYLLHFHFFRGICVMKVFQCNWRWFYLSQVFHYLSGGYLCCVHALMSGFCQLSRDCLSLEGVMPSFAKKEVIMVCRVDFILQFWLSFLSYLGGCLINFMTCNHNVFLPCVLCFLTLFVALCILFVLMRWYHVFFSSSPRVSTPIPSPANRSPYLI
ncbi:uncharacterized protein BO80DRAFT_218999 [Aspergillus ibericus CBS 121593]|uniref:Uncharacterized protein n=1 Tax=Aspergillus ibericus CBS 121593 TaxID=1448316 RepID=A0A395GP45_9EURO|nr:hypothetical protein BO80DRAFT_218999 [Aspergillus ibericus CBS 121593]RAK96728.1 hypothetical protein BO80DRAFT_218999 [Aspergillus ibericus CBS 121593]